MKILKLLNDPRIYIPILLLICFEAFMQSGLYKNLLKPDSYAFNVNRVRNIAVHSKIKPNVLILGTSVPYQGFNLPLMNKMLQSNGIIVQSAATEGAMIETQYAISRDLLEKLPSIKTVVLVADIALAWKSRFEIDIVNRSMMAQFPRMQSFQILKELEFNLKAPDYSFFIVRSKTYQADFRDFVLNPLYRIKKISRENKTQSSLYAHINDTPYSLAGLGIHNLSDCVKQASRATLKMDKKGLIRDETGRLVSDEHHRRAAIQTCSQAVAEIKEASENEKKYKSSKELYFRRLKIIFNYIHTKNKKIITVFPPYSKLVNNINSQKKINIWKKHLKQICDDGKISCRTIDSVNSLDNQDNLSYYYDVLHLNQKGSMKWTKAVADQLKKQKGFILGK